MNYEMKQIKDRYKSFHGGTPYEVPFNQCLHDINFLLEENQHLRSQWNNLKQYVNDRYNSILHWKPDSDDSARMESYLLILNKMEALTPDGEEK